jgi:hypothetical protein
MMFFRNQLVKSGASINDNGDTEIELDGNNILSSLKMHFAVAATSNAQADVLRSLISYITKIVVMGDGDYELCSLTGEELAALWYYDQHQPIDQMQVLYGYKTNRAQLNLNFGRYFNDPKLGVDLKQWDDIDLTITMADFSTVFNTSGLTCRIEKVLMEDMNQKPSHWLRKVELKSSKPSAANQEVNYTIPKDMTLRKVLFFLDSDLSSTTAAATNYPTTDSNEFSFAFNDGAKKLYDKARPKDMFREMAERYGAVKTHDRWGLVNTIAIDSQIGYVESVISSPVEEGTGADTTLVSWPDENGRYVIPKFAGTGDHSSVLFAGVGYMSSWVCAFDHLGVQDYLNTKAKNVIDVTWLPTTADHSFRMVKDELVRNN